MSKIDVAWEELFNRYDIEQKVDAGELFYISAEQIKEVKEPRLMTKFDTRELLPKVFGNKMAILPVSRGNYVIGAFELYQDFPEMKADIKRLAGDKVPDYLETIDIKKITSEAAAINTMGIVNILDDFLGESDMLQTVSGRMGSGAFAFRVDGLKKRLPYTIDVERSQIEIDGGFENRNVFSIIEGKNVVHSNFLIRQLYYPVRTWDVKINKPIRPVFMVYSNDIFRMLEYEFTDIYNYSSIRLVREQNYSLEDISISFEELIEKYKAVEIKPAPEGVPFIQADSFHKVISLVEHLDKRKMSKVEIAELLGVVERQSDYYSNACKYLGLAEKKRDEEGITLQLTSLGKKILKLKYKERQLEYVRLILEHQIFHEMFEIVIRRNQIPDKSYIRNRILELGLCGEGLAGRRASSVRGWLVWITNLVN